ncbi:hypothetical protein [Kitasatospora sp. NPDC091207]|uniref:hypothetical protein n=1 Tax=Kitasatospora sp. NPDC091207 TaxID=3364083 RepID=UPI0037FAF923
MRARNAALGLATALLISLSGGVAEAVTPAATPTVTGSGLIIDSYYSFNNSAERADAEVRCGARLGYGVAQGWWYNGFCKDISSFTMALYVFPK